MAAEDQREELAACLKKLISLAPAMPLSSMADWRAAARERAKLMNFAASKVGSVRDIAFETLSGSVKCRMYAPEGSSLGLMMPTLFYLHGGGFVAGDLDMCDPQCRALANGASIRVISIEYPLAPENKFPVALEATQDVIAQLLAERETLGIDTKRLAVGGDSAGANIATVLTLAMRSSAMCTIRYQFLIYPVLDLRMQSGSYLRNAVTSTLTSERMRWYIGQYLPSMTYASDPRASPILVRDLRGAPATFLVTAAEDPLVDEGRDYADQLAAQGVATEYRCYSGLPHGFWGWGGTLSATKQLLADLVERLKRILETDRTITADEIASNHGV